MHKYLFFFLILSFIKGYSSVYTIRSIEGLSTSIAVEFTPVDNIIQVINGKDKFIATDVSDLIEVKCLNEHFLHIRYQVRVGSNIRIERLMLISVSNENLRESLHIISRYDAIFNETYDKEIDALQIYNEEEHFSSTITKIDKSQIVLNSKYIKKSKELKESITKNEQFTLTFDTLNRIFKSKEEALSSWMKCFSPDNGVTTERNIEGIFPTITMFNYKYYFINRYWQELSDDNYLIRYLIGR